jgi:hypothetical protein
MPYNTPAPDFALLAAFDARQWAGVDVVRYNATDISLPSYATGSGVYEDGLFFLNGRGVADPTGVTNAMGTFQEALSSLATFNTTWTVTLTSDDKIKITSDLIFRVTPLDADVLGLGTTTAAPDGANFSVTAPNDWTRGVYSGERYQFDDLLGTSFDAFRSQQNRPWPAQDVLTMMRERGSGDVDDLAPTDCLEQLIIDQSSKEIRWLINDVGHVEVWYMSDGLFSWLDTSFRDRLGFSGREDAEPMGTTGTPYVARIVAEHPLPGGLFPSRPYQDHHYTVESVTQARRKIGGGYTSNLIGTYTTSALAFDLDALLDVRDLYRHFTDAFIPYAPNGERVNFYQGWGDSRRSLRSGLITFTQPPYDLVYTSEDNGDQGRLRCSLVTASYDLAFGSLKRRVPVAMRLEHL